MAKPTFEAHDLGLTWVVEEKMQRASHALVSEGRVWLVDPVDADDAIERATALGEVAGVIQLLDRHNRDCLATARKLGVHHLKVPDHIPASPFETVPVVRLPLWQETALWWPERSALIVAEAVGTTPVYTADRAEVGMHAFLRPFPPSALRRFEPRHLLVGHGHPLHGDAVPDALDHAYSHARSDIPHLLMALPGLFRR